MKQTQIAAILLLGLGSYSLTACAQDKTSSPAAGQSAAKTTQQAYKVEEFTQLNEPWALTELPDQRLLITERSGKLKLFNPANRSTQTVQGIPQVAYGGQGGLGDITLHPDFAKNQLVYFSYAEQGQGYGAVVVRGKLDLTKSIPQLTQIKKIWTQVPKFSSGQGHYGHRIIFGSDNKLWISSGERQQFNPAQDMNSNAGKIIRLNDDGSIPSDNPFMNQGEIAKQVWSLGHRNPLGLAFDPQGQLWVIEMGPKGGDELNKVIKGKIMAIRSSPMGIIMMANRFQITVPNQSLKHRHWTGLP